MLAKVRPNTLRQAGSYVVLASFLAVVFVFGVGDDIRNRAERLKIDFEDGIASASRMPDVSQYTYMNRLDSKTLRIDDPSRRLIFIGDVHGMKKQLDSLLSKVEYDPTKDLLIHVGDIIAKGSHAGSMAVLEYMSTHNITGVRGNHDEKVVEWRGWIDWVRSHHGGSHWLRKMEKMSAKEVEEYESETLKKKPKEKWKRIPKGWSFMKDHYTIARDMSSDEYKYLLRLPLVLHLPSLHTFVVHAGILPHDPRHPITSIRQPLAHIPKKLDVSPPKPAPSHIELELSPDAELRQLARRRAELASGTTDASGNKHSKWNMTALRNAQEVSVLADVPQNADAWTLMNMRGVTRDGEVTKANDEGVPWAKLWNSVISKCHGFDSFTRRDSDEEDDVVNIPSNPSDPLKSKDLPCYPTTVIYGHAAKRGLDIKRWSKGLDSGCVYNRKLTAMILTTRESNDHLSDVQSMRFGEDGVFHTEFVSVTC